mgnify:CR=1 FL=1
MLAALAAEQGVIQEKRETELRAAMAAMLRAAEVAPIADALARALHVDECLELLTEKGEWAFAKWEPPSPDAFSKPRPAAGLAAAPASEANFCKSREGKRLTGR